MPRQNYGYEKRQKELAKQKKRDEKRQRRLNKRMDVSEEPEEEQPADIAPEEPTEGETLPDSQ